MKYQFMGKTVVFEEGDEKVVAFGDLHLGYEVGLHQSGIDVEHIVWDELASELTSLFTRIGKVQYVVLLGDIKHQFARIAGEEWRGFEKLIALLHSYSTTIIIIKGNHDTFLSSLTRATGIEISESWIWKGWCFFHGDRDIPLIHTAEVMGWVVGHTHPAISLSDGEKQELYKCFLVGKYKKKNVILMPSFFSGVVGSDVTRYDLALPWKLRINRYTVFIAQENEALAFGTVASLM